MKRYLIAGLVVYGLIGCASVDTPKSNKIVKNSDSNKTQKILVINLDSTLIDYTKGGLRGDSKKATPIFIERYDKIELRGELLKKADKIRVGDNDEVAFNEEKYTIETSELKADELIVIYNGKKKIMSLRVRME